MDTWGDISILLEYLLKFGDGIQDLNKHENRIVLATWSYYPIKESGSLNIVTTQAFWSWQLSPKHNAKREREREILAISAM